MLGAMLLSLAMTGCGEKSDEASAAGTAGATTANAASPLDPRVRALADEHAKGMEADAKKTEAAMRKARTP